VTEQATMQRVRHMTGVLNVPPADRLRNIASAIRRGLPQVRAHAPNDETICLVGSGSSLTTSAHEIEALAADGCLVVALNGAYGWLIEHGIQPRAMVMVDGRAFNARFLTPELPTCTYFLASQCAPEVFDAARGRQIYLWHSLTGDDLTDKELLDGYYLNSWQPVSGGCTVGTRAIVLFRLLGYQKMHLFGLDSCKLDETGHANAQPENDADETVTVVCAGREFRCTAWQCEQALEFIDLIATNGEHFQLSVHGDGLLAHIIAVGGADDGTIDQLTEGVRQ
jgi:hypothetical protein